MAMLQIIAHNVIYQLLHDYVDSMIFVKSIICSFPKNKDFLEIANYILFLFFEKRNLSVVFEEGIFGVDKTKSDLII